MNPGPLRIELSVQLGLTLEIARAMACVLAARTDLERLIELRALDALGEIHEMGIEARRALGLNDGRVITVRLQCTMVMEKAVEPVAPKLEVEDWVRMRQLHLAKPANRLPI